MIFFLPRIQEQQWGECESRVEEGFEQWIVHLVDSGWSLLALGAWRVFGLSARSICLRRALNGSDILL